MPALAVSLETPAGWREGTDVRSVQDGYVSVTALGADRDMDGATQGRLRGVLQP